MGRGSSKAGNSAKTLSKGMTQSEEQNLHDLAMASLVWRDDLTGTNVTTPEEREKYRLQWKSGGQEFEKAQFNTLQAVAERNGIEDSFTFDDVRAQVRTPDGQFRIMGDDYAIARGNNERKWIVNELGKDFVNGNRPIVEQNRFSTPQDALDFVVKQRRKK